MKSVLVVPAMLMLVPVLCAAESQNGHLDTEHLPSYLRDRGIGVPTSMFGTYIQKGEILFYPFFEYYLDDDAEYSPAELGYDLDEDYRGKFRGSEGLIFLAYGLSDVLSIELEAAVMDATLEKSPDDPSSLPNEVSDSGIGDVQTQINWRWLRENERRPEMFSYCEVVFPTTEEHSLIGTSDWEFKVGTGITRGFGWGQMTVRGAIEYVVEEEKSELGEVAVEYLKRLSRKWRVYLGVEGAQDEVELITEAQWHVAPRVFVKVNNAFGMTSKATGWAPEIGVMFSF